MSEQEWTAALPLDELPEGTPTRVSVEGVDILLARDGDRLFATSNRCTHQGAPLSKGPLRFSGSLVTATCPVHGSQFALDTGKVLRGPATRPVAAYDVRVNEGMVEIRDRD
jgi:nitrite reductase/ring-hydroxylating ferredoxin subunit